MAITAAEQTSIVRLVVGMFNAAPGATYLNQISQIFEDNGHNLSGLAHTLSLTGAFQSVYNTGLTSQQFATAFLSTLGLEDNTSAVDFIVAKANSGEDRGNIILDAINILESVTATSGEVADARDMLNNKVEVALFFSVDQNNPETSLAALQAVLSTITADHATVDAAIFGIENPPQTFDLTINADVGAAFTGGEGNDTFTADAALSTVDLILRPTLGGNDDLHGGGGFDTLNAVVNGNFGLAAGDAPHIAEIEQLNFTVRNSGSLFGTDNEAHIDFGHVTGATEVAMVGSDDGSVLDLFNVQEMVNIAIRGLDGGYMDVTYDDDALGSETASQSAIIQDVTDSTLNVETNGGDTITSFNLQVQGGGDNSLFLDVEDNGGGEGGDYNTIQDLTIGGDGNLVLRGYYDFDGLVTLNSTGLSGDLDIDVSGGTSLESVLTGPGDDFVVVNPGIFDGDGVTVDLGGGDNVLSMFHDDIIEDGDLNAIDFSADTISNVQTLELNGEVDLYNDASLDVSNVGGLSTLSITDDFFGNHHAFNLTGPETLTVDVGGEVDALELGTSGILNLTINTNDGDLDLDSLTSADITSLTLNADATAWVDLNSFVDVADPEEDDITDNLSTLQHLIVNAGVDANVEINGIAATEPEPAEPGTQESGTVDVTANQDTSKGEGKDKTGAAVPGFQGTVDIFSSDLPGGHLLVNLDGTTDVTGAIEDALDGTGLLNATSDAGSVSWTWIDAGDKGDLSFVFQPSGDKDSVTFGEVNTTQGTDPVPGEGDSTDASGFEGLTDVAVNAGEDADVEITDALGAFTVVVNAGVDAEDPFFDADVSLDDTGATAVTVTAGDRVTVSIADSEDLTSVTLAAGDDEGGNSLILDNTDSVTLIDLSGITDNDNETGDDDIEDSDNGSIDVSVLNADFAQGVQILVGDSDLSFHMDALDGVRETFTFVGANTGAVVIDGNGVGDDDLPNGDGFLASVGGTGDRLDFSQMAGIDSLEDLAVTFQDGSTHITSLVAGVDVDITVVGANLSLDAFHFIF